MDFIDRKGNIVAFNPNKVIEAGVKALTASGANEAIIKGFTYRLMHKIEDLQTLQDMSDEPEPLDRTDVDNLITTTLSQYGCEEAVRKYVLYAHQKAEYRKDVNEVYDFLNNYTKAKCNADGTVDDNSNVKTKMIGNLNVEIYKKRNKARNRGMIMQKLSELFPDFDRKQYMRDLQNHIIYKNDETTSNSGATMPYCVSVSLFPFACCGLEAYGYPHSVPNHLLSYCSTFQNFVFTTASQFAGAVATSEFLIFFDYYARKDFGDDWYKDSNHRKFAEQMFQMVVHTINQPAGGRGMQPCFWNLSIFDRFYFDSMFGEMVYPDGETMPNWDSINELQKMFCRWFLAERKKCELTFPVMSYSVLTDGEGNYRDEEYFEFITKQLSEGDDSFIYNSDSADSLASCCRLKNEVDTKEFNFTNGNIGIMTGSKSVITLNLNRIAQRSSNRFEFLNNLAYIVKRVHKYHIAYNECIWDTINAGLLPVYTGGFIDADKQFLTIGLNGLNEAAEFYGLTISDNKEYQMFVDSIGSLISRLNKEANGEYFGHTCKFNCEFVPAEGLGPKNYNWDKRDGYKVPEDRNLYGSYVFLASQPMKIEERIAMHSDKYLGGMDGGSACHINLKKPLSQDAYKRLLKYSAAVGTHYITFNVVNSICTKCGHIEMEDVECCPVCGGKVDNTTKIIGYRTNLNSWSAPRKEFFKTWVLATE